MNVIQRTPEERLAHEQDLKLRNNRTGLFVFQLTWMLVFVSLIFVNLLMRGNAPSWPPPGIDRLDWILPTVATVGLLLSSLLAHRALKALTDGRARASLESWRSTLILGAIFVAIMGFEWLNVPFSEQYGAIFRVMTGFHAIHALAIGLYIYRVMTFTRAGVYTAESLWPVEAGMKMWDFVTVAWLLFYLVLYVI